MQSSETPRHAVRLTLLLLVLSSVLAVPQRASAQQPWEGPAFSAEPAELVSAAAAAVDPAERGVVVLLSEEELTLDEDGRATRVSRIVYRIGPEGPGQWTLVSALWQPWRQERPVLRARVSTADGRVQELDARAVSEASLGSRDGITFIDMRAINAPLPLLIPGAVVEYEVVTRDLAPAFAGGALTYFPVGRQRPVLRTRITVRAPENLPVRYVTRLVPEAEPLRSLAEDVATLTFDFGPHPALGEANVFGPSDVPIVPYVAVTSAETWTDLAESYHALVEEKIAESDVGSLVAELIEGVRTRDGILRRLMAEVQLRVRYTAVELGEAAIVPNAPGDTLAVGYGDCKDQATLLVAMLRAAGIEAHVALLSVGPGPDLEPSLPGIGAFDHAIVYVPGEEPLWLDPTAGFAQPGQIPWADQGRLALIAAPGSAELSRIPEETGLVTVTREIYLAEEGPGRVVEVGEASGWSEIELRAQYGAAPESQLRQTLEEYAESVYGAEDIGDLSYGDPRDFETPFEARAEIIGSRLVNTVGGAAAVYLPLAPILSEVMFLASVHDGWRRAEGIPQTDVAPASDLLLPSSQTTEWRYQIVPPPGFRESGLPESRSESLGVGMLSWEFSSNTDHTVEGLVRFESGRRYSVAEVADFMSTISSLDAYLLLTFESVGRALLDEGEVREAIAEFERLSALYPENARHQTDLARALVAGGMGDAAREAALRGTALEPDSVSAHRALGWVLQHDRVGRLRAPGADFSGARAAYEQALELEPDDTLARSDLAILLEHNMAGVRYGDGADLEAAIENYLALPDLGAESSTADNLESALLRAGRFADLADRTDDDALYLAAVAAIDGPEAALDAAVARIRSQQERQIALARASRHLMDLRLYPESLGLVPTEGVPAGAAGAATALNDRLGRLQRFEDLALEADDPQDVAKRALIALILDRREDLRTLLVGELQELDLSASSPTPTITLSGMVSSRAMLDMLLLSLEPFVEGDRELGYRIDVVAPALSRLYLTAAADGLRVAAFEGRPEFLGLEALRRLEEGDLSGARGWLDWATLEIEAGFFGPDPMAGPPFTRLWQFGVDQDEGTIRNAIAALLATSRFADLAIPLLESALEGPESDETPVLELALYQSHLSLGEYETALAIIQRLVTEYPNSQGAHIRLAETLSRLGRGEEAVSVLDARFGESPDNFRMIGALARAYGAAGGYDRADALLTELLDQGDATADDRYDKVWFSLFYRPITGEDLALLEQMPPRDAQSMRTMAIALAEVDRPSDALRTLHRSMEVSQRDEPDPDDWYAFGRIYEQLGAKDAAEGAYGRMAAPSGDPPPEGSSQLLAARRLNALFGN